MTELLERLKVALADRYRLERELGAGGMATVYLAEDLKHQRKVAIKVLRPELAAALGPDRFLREISIAARLSHPHILSLIDSGEVDGFPYYVMPYVAGVTLRQRLVREGGLPVADAVRILRDVADALSAAHAQGVIHRDIKPENVMLAGRHALVMDFGVAKALATGYGRDEDGASDPAARTSVGMALGTPAYMSPEQAGGEPLVDHRADIYSWGVMAYELLAGQPPFVRPTLQSTLAAHLTAIPEPVTAHRTNLPDALARLVMQSLEKGASDRPQAADELVRQLDTVVTPGGAITPTSTRPYPSISAREARRRTAIRAAWLGAALLLGAGAWWFRPGRAVSIVEERVLVMPLEAGDTDFPELATALDGLPPAIEREGLGTPVPTTVVRDLALGRTGPGEVDWLVARTGAGQVLRTTCRGKGDVVACQLELFRMPAGVLRLSVPVAGGQGDSTLPRRIEEQALVMLLLQQRWGDRTSWQGEHVPPSLEATRAFIRGHDAWFEKQWGDRLEWMQRASALDSNMIRARAVVAEFLAAADRDSTIATLARRDGLSDTEREYLTLLAAVHRGDYEAAAPMLPGQFRRWPEMYAIPMSEFSQVTDRPSLALAAAALADSLPPLGSWVGDMVQRASVAYHQLGRHSEALEVSRKVRARFPHRQTHLVEILALAGLGDTAGVRRVVDESEGRLEAVSGAGTRAFSAGMELMAHGQPEAGRAMLQRAIRSYRSRRDDQGDWSWVQNEIWSLEWTDQLEAAAEVAAAVLREGRDPGSELCDLPGSLARIAARQGRQGVARQYQSELTGIVERSRAFAARRPSRRDADSALAVAASCKYQRATIAARLGDREGAVRFIHEARTFPHSQAAYFWWAHRDPDLMSLRGYPPFDALLAPKE